MKTLESTFLKEKKKKKETQGRGFLMRKSNMVKDALEGT